MNKKTAPKNNKINTQTQDKPTMPTENNTFDIQTFESIRNILTKQAQRLEEIKTETKLLNEELKSLLENDPTLVKATEEAKQASQKAKVRKTEILETTEAKNLKLKISDVREEKKDIEESLSSYLFDLYRTTGVMEFEDTLGNVWEYDIKAKLKSKKSN